MNILPSICLLYFISLNTGTDGDSVTLEDYSQSKAITSCKEGLIANVDNFTTTARITSDINTLQGRKLVLILKYEKGMRLALLICNIYFSASCTNVRSFKGCICKGYKNGTFEIFINQKPLLSESEATIFLKWPAHGIADADCTGNITLPVIYSQEQASLHVGKRPLDLANCSAYFDTNDVLEFCVYNLLGQTVTISTDYGTASTEKNCVRHTFRFLQAKSNYFNVSFEEHRGCQRRKTYTCRWYATAESRKSTNCGTSFDCMPIGWIVIVIVCSHPAIEKIILPF